MHASRIALAALLPAALATGCFGSSVPRRSYFVLHGVTASARGAEPIRGLVRVRTLDSESIYEKFQIVVRKSPFELTYSEDNVWAVKPNQMVSDVIARALAGARRFNSVAREYGETRPDFVLSGSLHAIEVYDSEDVWYAHLGLSLRLTRFDTGEALLTYRFDERKPVPSRTFSHAARAISELLSTAMDELISESLQLTDGPESNRERPAPEQPGVEEPPTTDDEVESPDASPAAEGVLFVPETPGPEPARP